MATLGFVAALGLSLARWVGAALCRSAQASHCSGFPWRRAQALGARASVVAALGAVVVAHGLSCSVVCGIFLDQELNQCPLHWQMDSYPLYHQRSSVLFFYLFHRCGGTVYFHSRKDKIIFSFSPPFPFSLPFLSLSLFLSLFLYLDDIISHWRPIFIY